MMNDTVARIVDLMFDNVEMNEEVAALRDEVMNNCQDRYSDLVNSGMAEDDAVAAVVESLRGMEDVIAQYQRKSRQHSQPAAAYETYTDVMDGEQEACFSAGEVSRIDLVLESEDVTVEPSDDHMYHVLWENDGDAVISAQAQGGVLRVERQNIEKKARHADRYEADFSYDDPKQAMDNISSMMEKLGRTIGNFIHTARSAFNGVDSVTIRIPVGAAPGVKLVTTSGDIDVHGVQLSGLQIISTSGDIDVDLSEDEHIDDIEMRTTSGDVDATVFARRATLGSTSGDVEVEGRIETLNVSTISGDIDVRADVQNVSFKAISGDVELLFDSDEIRTVNGSTISGDIDIDLPNGIGVIAINTSTRSGDLTTRHHADGVGPVVSGSVSSMSGDITIR